MAGRRAALCGLFRCQATVIVSSHGRVRGTFWAYLMGRQSANNRRGRSCCLRPLSFRRALHRGARWRRCRHLLYPLDADPRRHLFSSRASNGAFHRLRHACGPGRTSRLPPRAVSYLACIGAPFRRRGMRQTNSRLHGGTAGPGAAL